MVDSTNLKHREVAKHQRPTGRRRGDDISSAEHCLAGMKRSAHRKMSQLIPESAKPSETAPEAYPENRRSETQQKCEDPAAFCEEDVEGS